VSSGAYNNQSQQIKYADCNFKGGVSLRLKTSQKNERSNKSEYKGNSKVDAMIFIRRIAEIFHMGS